MTPPAGAEIFALRLAHNFTTSIKDPSYDGCIDIRDKAVEKGGTRGERHPRQTDAILEDDPLSTQGSTRASLDADFAHPCIELVLYPARTIARRSRIRN